MARDVRAGSERPCRGRPSGSQSGQAYGVPGVQREGARYRVRFAARNSYGFFATLEEAQAVARAVVEFRDRYGFLPSVPDVRLRRSSPRSDARTGFKGVQFVRGRYRVRLRIDGKLRYFGSFDNLEEAKARSRVVQADRARAMVEACKAS